MTTRAPFLDQRYGAYHHRFVPKEDEEFTHVGPGTPCGEYLRRFWHPICPARSCRSYPLPCVSWRRSLLFFVTVPAGWGSLSCTVPIEGRLLSMGR